MEGPDPWHCARSSHAASCASVNTSRDDKAAELAAVESRLEALERERAELLERARSLQTDMPCDPAAGSRWHDGR